MKHTASLVYRWATSLCMLALIAAAFYAGLRWQGIKTGKEASVKEAEAAVLLPAIPEPASLSAGPDAIRLTADFEPMSAMVIGASDLILSHPQVLADLAREFDREGLPVILLVSDAQQKSLCEQVLKQAGILKNWVHLAVYPLNTMWIRDFAPLFVVRSDHTFSVVDASYTSADDGAQNRWRDDELPIVLSEVLGLPLSSMPLRLDGGNLLSNGEGCLLSTTELIINNQSRGYGPKKVMTRLKHYLAAEQWSFIQTLEGEATGHVDIFATLLRPNLALVAQADPAVDPLNAALLDEAVSFISQIRTSQGPMQVFRVPLLLSRDGHCRSYTNVIMANNLVLVPVFSDVDPGLQEGVLDTYRRLLPEKRVVGIPCDSLVSRYGFLRCISFGIPEGVEWQRLQSWDLAANDE